MATTAGGSTGARVGSSDCSHQLEVRFHSNIHSRPSQKPPQPKIGDVVDSLKRLGSGHARACVLRVRRLEWPSALPSVFNLLLVRPSNAMRRLRVFSVSFASSLTQR